MIIFVIWFPWLVRFPGKFATSLCIPFLDLNAFFALVKLSALYCHCFPSVFSEIMLKMRCYGLGERDFFTHLAPFLKLVHLLCPMNECGKFWSSSFLQTFFSLFFFMCEKPTSSMNICGLSEAQHKENQCKGFWIISPRFLFFIFNLTGHVCA